VFPDIHIITLSRLFGRVVANKPNAAKVYLPPDVDCLLSVLHHCLKSRHKVNAITAGKYPSPQWLFIEEATFSVLKNRPLFPAFDISVMNKLNRYNLVIDECNILENMNDEKLAKTTKWSTAYLTQEMQEFLVKRRHYTH